MTSGTTPFSAYPVRRRSVWHLRDGFWDLLMWFPLFLVYFTSLQQGVGWWDSGELIAAVKELTVAHRPGFPLYVLAGHVLAGWANDPRIWANLLSAVCAASALLILWRAFRLLQGGGALTAGWILAGGWLTGLSPLFWRQAVRAEVYAPAFLVMSIALLFAVGAQRAPDPRYAQRRFVGAAYFAGLAFCVHTALAVTVWPALVYLFVRGDFRPSARQWLRAGLACAAGLSVYLYVPLRALHAPYVWGDPATLGGFWQYLTASDSYSVIASEASGTASRLVALFGVLKANMPGLLFGLGAIGLAFGAFRSRASERVGLWLVLAGGLVAATVVSTVIADNLDLQAYLFPLLLAAWWGWNQLDPARWLSEMTLPKTTVRLSGLVLTLISLVATGFAYQDGSNATSMFRVGAADQWGHALLAGARDGELLVVQDANTDFLLRGLLASDSTLPRVVVLNTALSPAAWYRRWWSHRHFTGEVPGWETNAPWAYQVAAWWKTNRSPVWVDLGCQGWTPAELTVDGWLAHWDSTARESEWIPQFVLNGAEVDPDWVRTAVWYYYRLGAYYRERGQVRPAALSWAEGLRWAPGESTLLNLKAELSGVQHADLDQAVNRAPEAP